MRLFVTGTGTDVGKTYVGVALLRAWVRMGLRPAGLKPFETGCAPIAVDAEALAEACGRPELATLDGLYRATLPAAPYTATLEGESPPSWTTLASVVQSTEGNPTLIEGAGGPLVPVDEKKMVVDLAKELDAGVLLVAANQLGVLSHTLTAAESIQARGLTVLATVLTQPRVVHDPTIATNARILAEHLEGPVFELGHGSDDVEALARHLIG